MGRALNGGIVDAHVHVWDVDAMPIPWFRDDLGLPRRASTADLTVALDGTGVCAAVGVQAADSDAEARWLVSLTETDAVLRRAVLQYRPGGPATLSGRSVAGVRAAVPQFAADLSDVDGLDALAETLGEEGRVLELLLRPEQLPAAGALSRRHPGTAIVVCHLGLGAGAAGAVWEAGLAAAASAPGLYAKVSGLTLPARGADEGRAIVHRAVDLFGADRLLYGSDWPMWVRGHSYDEVIAATAAALPHRFDGTGFWGATASRLYALDAPAA